MKKEAITITQEIIAQYRVNSYELITLIDLLRNLKNIAQKSSHDGIVPIRIKSITPLEITDSPVPNFIIAIFINPTRILLNLINCTKERESDTTKELDNLFAALNTKNCISAEISDSD